MKTLILYSFLSILLTTMAVGDQSGVLENDTSPKDPPIAVVQLFTSQGCSSCPGADLLLDQIKKEYAYENVYVLSYHVDYWDRLGWKDPFSRSDFTILQKAYGFKFNTRTVYTPQAIVNGLYQFVGSNRGKMAKYLSRALKTGAENSITFSEIEKKNDAISFSYTVNGNTRDKSLKVALVVEQRKTYVKRGENGGRTLLNSNIVVEEIEIALSGKAGKTKIAIPSIVTEKDALTMIAYVQTNNLSITGAGMLEL